MNKIIIFIIFLIYYVDQVSAIHYCTNGIDPSSLTDKEYLLEFSKGNCSPVILIPPLTGVRLQFQITNCTEFKTNNPSIFQKCGWTHCEKKIYEFWKKVPKTEYSLWLSDLFTPMSVLSYSKKASNCFASLLDVKLDLNKPPKDTVVETKGYRVTYYGNTPETAQDSDCGEKASNEIFPKQLQFIFKQKVWQLFIDQMTHRGYRRGLTYQFIPYDFRLSIENNELNELFQPNLKRIYSITGKKSYIVSLSYGVNNSYYQITKLSKKQKDMVKGLIGFGGNFAGTIQADLSLLTPWDYYKLGPFGLHYDAGLEVQQNLISIYENTTRDPFTLFKGEKFMDEIQKRIDYEEGRSKVDKSIYAEFLPDLDQECTPLQFEWFGNTCKLGFPNQKMALMIMEKYMYYRRKDMGQMIKDWSNNTSIYKKWKKFQQEEFFKLKNPQVPVILFNLRTSKTPSCYSIDNFAKNIHKKKYINPYTYVEQGDKVVTSFSLNIAALKWAYEYKTQSVEGAQPVKIIDVCGLYNQGKSIYDGYDDKGQKTIEKNNFIGLKCRCMLDKNPDKCIHTFLLADQHHADYFGTIIESNEVSYSEDYEKHVNSLDDLELYKMTISNCPQTRY